jgi:hypothetical protein
MKRTCSAYRHKQVIHTLHPRIESKETLARSLARKEISAETVIRAHLAARPHPRPRHASSSTHKYIPAWGSQTCKTHPAHPDRHSVGRLTRPPRSPWSHLCLPTRISTPVCGHPGDEFLVQASCTCAFVGHISPMLPHDVRLGLEIRSHLERPRRRQRSSRARRMGTT